MERYCDDTKCVCRKHDRRTLGERRLDLVNPRTGETVRDSILRIERRQGGDRRATEER